MYFFFFFFGVQPTVDFKCGKAAWLGHSGHKVRSRAGKKKAQAHFCLQAVCTFVVKDHGTKNHLLNQLYQVAHGEE